MVTEEPVEVYVCNTIWAAIQTTISRLLLLFEILGLIAKYLALGPNILGYVSTMTRDNSYIPLSPEGGFLDGMERAKLLKDLHVKLQDVSSPDEDAHIALISRHWRRSSPKGKRDLRSCEFNLSNACLLSMGLLPLHLKNVSP